MWVAVYSVGDILRVVASLDKSTFSSSLAGVSVVPHWRMIYLFRIVQIRVWFEGQTVQAKAQGLDSPSLYVRCALCTPNVVSFLCTLNGYASHLISLPNRHTYPLHGFRTVLVADDLLGIRNWPGGSVHSARPVHVAFDMYKERSASSFRYIIPQGQLHFPSFFPRQPFLTTISKRRCHTGMTPTDVQVHRILFRLMVRAL